MGKKARGVVKFVVVYPTVLRRDFERGIAGVNGGGDRDD